MAAMHVAAGTVLLIVISIIVYLLVAQLRGRLWLVAIVVRIVLIYRLISEEVLHHLFSCLLHVLPSRW